MMEKQTTSMEELEVTNFLLPPHPVVERVRATVAHMRKNASAAPMLREGLAKEIAEFVGLPVDRIRELHVDTDARNLTKLEAHFFLFFPEGTARWDEDALRTALKVKLELVGGMAVIFATAGTDNMLTVLWDFLAEPYWWPS
jgi:hypothetical protein